MAQSMNQSMTSLVPPTTNSWLTGPGGTTLLYNTTLVLMCSGLAQHGIVIGLAFLVRGFSCSRVLELHYLIFLLAITFIAAPLVFVVDRNIDALKIFFFMEHEAVEYLIAARVFLPRRIIRDHSGATVLCLWLGLTVLTWVVSLNDFHHVGTVIVGWNAFMSDFLLGAAGIRLMRNWWVKRSSKEKRDGGIEAVILRAEAMAGIGFASHGFITMSVGPILVAMLYSNANPAWWPYAWALIFAAAMVGIGVFVPAIMLFFNTIHWGCCWHRRSKHSEQIYMCPESSGRNLDEDALV